jgi:cytochrome b6-f complex iron-sulfur subunit
MEVFWLCPLLVLIWVVLCPCHSSAFDKFGSVINSPAPRPLDYFPLTVEAGKVKIDLNQKTKRKKFEKNQVTYAI